MFYRHVILNVNGEEVLYLYLTSAYEFSNDLRKSDNEDDQTIPNRILNYIKNRGISFKGNSIYLVVDGIVVGSVTLKDIPKYRQIVKDYIPEYEKIKKVYNQDKMNPNYIIILERENGVLEQIPLRKYLISVLASTVLPTFHEEVLKAQAVICRTYALKKLTEEHKIKAVNAQQIYRDISYYKFIWGKDYFTYIQKLEKAIDDTKGQYLTYQNKIIEPDYHIVSNGRTENVQGAPYLNSVSSIWDMDAPIYSKTTIKTLEEVAKLLQISQDQISDIQILELTPSNRVKKVRFGKKVFSGQELMNLLDLPSMDISFVVEKDKIRFITRGVGHGMGLSQYGANGMAKSGFYYMQILSHYYPNTKLNRIVLNNQ